MYEIRRDTQRNRLYVTIGSPIDKETYTTMRQGIEQAVADLSPGFTCLTDLRKYKRITEDEEVYIALVQQWLKDAGLSLAVRLERRMALHEHVQFETGSMDAGYRSDVAWSLEEAEAILDRPRGRRHL